VESTAGTENGRLWEWSMAELAIGLIGAGAIGRAHADAILTLDVCRLAGVADPTVSGRSFAEGLGAPSFADHLALLAEARPDAVIVATPNDTHLPLALDAIAAGVPVLVEKPIAANVADGEALAGAALLADVPVLVGHHRRHNPIIRRARALVADGALGTLTNVTVLYTFYKHDAYFDVEWRRRAGGGPILINLIHEIDLIRHVCGEIASVQAAASNAVRGFEVEDTAAVLLRLTNGALVTISLSDAAVAPWSWDLASGENPAYPEQPAPVSSHYLSGTKGSLTLPGLELWTYAGERSWFTPISYETVPIERASPYLAQIRHLCRVARREEAPLITAVDATNTLRATLAVVEAVRTGATVKVEAKPC
jgi:predicted dehydrogenase